MPPRPGSGDATALLVAYDDSLLAAVAALLGALARGRWSAAAATGDDGAGGADPQGGGLRCLRDRVATVDGELRVISPRGGGTVVEARLPLGPLDGRAGRHGA